MLSVILYGRNDSHGYNLHKRAALSLNCIAEVLGGDDEILFSDYNTADELPTFPEAIADTLTPTCKARLRILRTRPAFHAQFAGRTRLAALECQARNIAIRRSNPASRWVLSTNTDMIFCPRGAGGLNDIAAQLEDGFYHLPRFEAPEGIWERLPRGAPGEAIAAIREAGLRFHLNEVVYGSYDSVYEGPGDFQLFLRQDLFDISGFDERMILGWHADANMARRMKLLRGQVRSLFGALAGYHCGHSRQATQFTGRARTENDELAFVRDITDPHAPWQADSWGANGLAIEEIRLDGPDVYFSALRAASPEEGPQFFEATAGEPTFAPELYGKIDYDADHVLPHLCDLLYNLPPDRTVLVCGDDERLLHGARAFLDAAGRRIRFIQARHPGAAPLTFAERLPMVDALRAADVFLIQYPSPRSHDRREHGWRAKHLLTVAAIAERDRPAAERRRFILVNAMQNPAAEGAADTLAPSLMPFSTRLLQGYVQDWDSRPAPAGWSAQERDLLAAAIKGLLADDPPRGWERLALQLGDIASSPEERAAFALAPAQAGVVARAAAEAVRQACGRAAETPVPVAPRPGAGSRLCSAADAQDAQWRGLAEDHFYAAPSCFMGQGRWVWERVSLIDQLSRLFPLLDGRVLLVAAAPDFLGPLLAHLGFQVAYVTADALLDGALSDWSELFAQSPLNIPSNHRPFEAAAQDRFDAVVMVSPAWIEKGLQAADAMLQKIAPLCAKGALLLATATVQLNDQAYDGAFTLAEWRAMFEPNGPLGSRGFVAEGAIDPAIPLDTVVRFAPGDEAGDTIPGLSYGFLDSFQTSAIVSARWPARLAPGRKGRLRRLPAEEQDIHRRLGRQTPFSPADRALLTEVFGGLAADAPPPGWRRLATEIAAVAAAALEGSNPLRLSADHAAKALEAAQAAVEDALARVTGPTDLVGPRAGIATRLCSGADWEDGGWSQVAGRLFSPEVMDLAGRRRWTWEKVSLIANLLEAAEQRTDLRVLLLAPGPDPLAHLLAHLGFEVTCATSGEILGETSEAEGWAEILKTAWLQPARQARLWVDAPSPPASFDAVVASQASLLEAPPTRLDSLLSAIAPLMTPQAVLHAAAAVELGRQSPDEALALAAWRDLHGPHGLLGSRGWTRAGETDLRMPRDAVVRFSPDGDDSLAPGLSWGRGGGLMAVGLAAVRRPSRA